MINRVINLPTVNSEYSKLYCRSKARSGASRKSSGSVSGRCRKNDGVERSVEREVAKLERSGERDYRNRLERGAAFSVTDTVLTLDEVLDSRLLRSVVNDHKMFIRVMLVTRVYYVVPILLHRHSPKARITATVVRIRTLTPLTTTASNSWTQAHKTNVTNANVNY